MVLAGLAMPSVAVPVASITTFTYTCQGPGPNIGSCNVDAGADHSGLGLIDGTISIDGLGTGQHIGDNACEAIDACHTAASGLTDAGCVQVVATTQENLLFTSTDSASKCAQPEDTIQATGAFVTCALPPQSGSDADGSLADCATQFINGIE